VKYDENSWSSRFDELAQERPEPSARVFEALRAELAASPSRTARNPSRGERLALSAGWLALSVFVCSFPMLGTRTSAVLTTAAGISLGGLLLLTVAVPGPKRRLSVGARRGLVVGLVTSLIATLCFEAGEFLPLDDAFRVTSHGLSCFSHALGAGLLGALGLAYLWRHTDPFTPGWSGALLGSLAGTLGALYVGLACASREGWHLALAHGGAAVLCTLLFALAARRWLRP
jgi:hypothetical protein